MKITVYTINDCKFSQAEREYLKKNNIEYNEKNLETNRDFLTEMLAISNNFAGTPVTHIEKDNGEKIVLKGFTAEEFDKALGITTAEATPAQPAPAEETIPKAQAGGAPQEQKPTEPVVVEALSQDSTSEVSMSEPQQAQSAPAPVNVVPESVPMMSQPSPTIQPPISPVSDTPVTDPIAPPITPTSQENIGPISLDVTGPAPQQSEPAPSTDTVMTPSSLTMPEPIPPLAPQTMTPPQDSQSQGVQPPPQAQADPLNSVLQNLQTQVDQASTKKEDNPPPQQ